MGSLFVLENNQLRIYLHVDSNGESLVPDHINIGKGSGDNVTLTIQQAKSLYVMLGDALKEIEKIGVRNG